MSDTQIEIINKLRSFLIEYKVLNQYVEAIVDPRTAQGFGRGTVYPGGLLTVPLTWSDSDRCFPVEDYTWHDLYRYWSYANSSDACSFDLTNGGRQILIDKLLNRNTKTMRLFKALREVQNSL